MVDSENCSSPLLQLSDMANFTWCALVALKFAKLDGNARNSLTEHSFLQCWLLDAKKQHRFPRSVCAEIDFLLQIARRSGPSARLKERITALWNASIFKPEEHTELARFSRIIASFKKLGWKEITLRDTDWNIASIKRKYELTDAVVIRGIDLVRCFSDSGVLISPFKFIVTGKYDELIESIKLDGINVEKDKLMFGVYTLIPNVKDDSHMKI